MSNEEGRTVGRKNGTAKNQELGDTERPGYRIKVGLYYMD